MLTINSPSTYIPERKYIIGLLFGDFLGLEHRIQFNHETNITIGDSDGKKLVLADIFFQTPRDVWLTPTSLPKKPLLAWDSRQIVPGVPLIDPKIPVIFGKLQDVPTKKPFMPLDILGSSFFMLSRYEELTAPEHDRYGRFPASASLAFQNGFLERPIINEYLEILWGALKQIWPGLSRKKRSFRLIASHDVDIPFAFLFQPLWKLLLKMGSDISRQKNLSLALKNFVGWTKVRIGHKIDPFNTFEWIMDQSERAGIKSSFHIMSGGRTPMDYYYPIESPDIQSLIKKIINRGHEIGFHPSYKTATDGYLWRKEFELLKASVKGCDILGGRQHFLQFRVPSTWRFWSENGLVYDSTLLYADHAGFRCGTCYEYPVFDLEERKEMNLRERPLVVMDRTVIDDPYQSLGATQTALDYMLTLKYNCQKFRGDFVLLWHNQRFIDQNEREIYRNLIGAN
jgi:hypothetical protein